MTPRFFGLYYTRLQKVKISATKTVGICLIHATETRSALPRRRKPRPGSVRTCVYNIAVVRRVYIHCYCRAVGYIYIHGKSRCISASSPSTSSSSSSRSRSRCSCVAVAQRVAEAADPSPPFLPLPRQLFPWTSCCACRESCAPSRAPRGGGAPWGARPSRAPLSN